jgi:hypothetical protein
MPKSSTGKTSKEVKDKILAVLSEQLNVFENDKMPLKEVVIAVGYTHENTKGFLHPFKELKEEGLVTRANGFVALTDKGLRLVPRDVKAPSTTNEAMQERYYDILEKQVDHKSKLKQFWNILLDGKTHSEDDIVKQLGYNHKNSKGYTNPKSVMKKLNLIESVGTGTIRATDKVYPKGRP